MGECAKNKGVFPNQRKRATGGGVREGGRVGAEKGVEKVSPLPPAAHGPASFSCGKAVDHLERGGLILIFCCTARACPGTARSSAPYPCLRPPDRPHVAHALFR